MLLLGTRDRARTRNEPGVYRSFKLVGVGLIYDHTSSNFGFITARVSRNIILRLKGFLAHYIETRYHTFKQVPKCFESVPKEPSPLNVLQGHDFSFPAD